MCFLQARVPIPKDALFTRDRVEEGITLTRTGIRRISKENNPPCLQPKGGGGKKITRQAGIATCAASFTLLNINLKNELKSYLRLRDSFRSNY